MTEHIDVLMHMRATGNGFESRLADAWLYADSENLARLSDAFADVYAKFAESQKKEAA